MTGDAAAVMFANLIWSFKAEKLSLVELSVYDAILSLGQASSGVKQSDLALGKMVVSERKVKRG